MIDRPCNDIHIRYLPPKGEDAGDAPKAGVEFPNAGDEEAPKVVVEAKGEEAWGAPNTPVEVPPNIELPVCAPKGADVPKGVVGAKGLLLALLVWPNKDWDPNGLLPDDWPKAITTIFQKVNFLLKHYKINK